MARNYKNYEYAAQIGGRMKESDIYLRKVHINNSTQHQNIFLFIWLLELEISSCCQDSFYSTHSIIIVVLSRVMKMTISPYNLNWNIHCT